MEKLAEAYRDVLADLPLHWIDKTRSHEAEYAKLSGLFLPGTSPAYQLAEKKILVIGRETRRWDVLKAGDTFESLEAYIFKAMQTQQEHLAKYINDPKDRGESFFNLLRDLAKDHSPQGIAWANLFCFAWNEKSPMNWENFEKLSLLSERLLKAQLKILKPDIVIFANGASSARYRQAYFPYKGDSRVCSNFESFKPHVPASQLWKFKLYDSIQCFRIQHPSSISANSRAARRFLLEHLRGNI